ncbi:beta-adducin isoform X1 [Panthera onca]|uniref:beta-adducin isoform X1 n=1 Tax=Panthera onca TaxID=9690 RepID=UPI002952FF11|nr:beta-adducin isoform X1 [Panthera onca]XP_060514252.1 beta-adducin isoform X1 [Panthera onca]XP_060514261.1 beta-adducin isoform X1 [Panthera onca]XP_060514270.1 beta-adducin isoform X1 [Panthera onca]XP_060514281.1 beta-adducin isoform X1 [Panthera onca]XP_060514290.1 beta-adducin isoform X1 [Panthera onca]XP_060514299.1 beta-adducin isoform X1 [Panthera onca]XP_060514301.1 beta-adducin isoform X1 [Panthera onca]XP_060514310.1 beta-adducin isoform X1 [Panthera onca]XP_060514318.1 beta-
MSEETVPEAASPPPPQGQQYFDRFSEDDPEYLRLRGRAADLRQDFNLMEQKKRVTMILQSPVSESFREELEGLIQEQMKKGNNSSNIWALRQIADFMASTSHAVFPTSSMNFSMMTPINDLHTADTLNLAKGERLMRCKISSVYRLLDLYGWAQLSDTYVTLRVSKEQDHFLISPKGVSCSEVTASSLIKVNILGEVVEKGSSCFPVDTTGFCLHSAIYAARPDVRCIIHLHTPATAAVSAMKCGLLPVSHNALLVGDMAYYDFNGGMEQEADRISLQKCLGPTCKILVLRNHGVVALGDTVEEAFYKVFHLQAACEIQVSALSSAGGVENLILLEQEKHRPHEVGSVQWAGSTFGPMQKSRLGEHEFEALMRMLDNLGYRTGYAYRYPFVQEKTKHKSEVEIPATVTAFVFEEDGVPMPALRQHAQKQQKEKTRWLNTPNTYLRVNVADEVQRSMGSPRPKTTWMKADEVEKSSSGMPIRIENPNQFVPLYTDPQEVLDMRNKIREQNRQDVKSAGPQSQLLASVIAEKSRSPSTESQLMSKGDADTKDDSEETVPNPFSQLTDQELEEYKKEVERKKLELDGEKETTAEEPGSPVRSAPASPAQSPAKSETKSPLVSPSKSLDEGAKTETSKATTEPETTQPEGVVVNGKEEEQTAEEILSKGLSQMTTNADTDVDTSKDKTESVTSGPMSPEGSPSKSPSKKKKKFRTPSFLKKSKKKEKVES